MQTLPKTRLTRGEISGLKLMIIVIFDQSDNYFPHQSITRLVYNMLEKSLKSASQFLKALAGVVLSDQQSKTHNIFSSQFGKDKSSKLKINIQCSLKRPPSAVLL